MVDPTSLYKNQLIRRGRSVLGEVRSAAESASDPEVQARAGAIVRALTTVRWRTDLTAALIEAAEMGKPLFVYSTMGPTDALL